MLMQFSVENYLSFDKEVTFSMLATGGSEDHPRHLIQDDKRKNGNPLLRVAALYGANASGKSNLIKAISFAQVLVLEGTKSGHAIQIAPFKLRSMAATEPSKFSFIFNSKGVIYNYGFVLNAHRILEEWLFATPRSHEVRFFERTTTEENKIKVAFGPSLTGKSAEQRGFLEFVAKGTRPNQLFLTEAVDRNVESVLPVIEWFRNSLIVIHTETRNVSLEFTAHESKTAAEFMSAFLQDAGAGIDGLTTEELPFDIETLPGMSDMQKREVTTQIDNLPEGAFVHIESPEGKFYGLKRGKSGKLVRAVLQLQHRDADGKLIAFGMDEESEGTQRLLHLLPALILLKENEHVILIDELDRRLHPLLSRLFLEAIVECNDATKRGQMIFTTHETNLLDFDLLRRDGVWFVEKDKHGSSHLYSLAEFKIRPDLKIQKGYLNGRFGAIPFLGDLSKLRETREEESATHAAVGEA